MRSRTPSPPGWRRERPAPSPEKWCGNERTARVVRAPRGSELRTKGWLQEAALRCLMNNLDPDGGREPRRAGRVRRPGQGGAEVGRLRRHRAQPAECSTTTRRCWCSPASRSGGSHPRDGAAGADRQQPAGARLGDWEHFWELEAAGLMMYGQMTAGSWIYIGTQGILQGTYQTFVAIAEQRFGGTLRRHADADRRPRRDGWRPAAGDHDERRRGAVRRRRSRADPAPAGDPISR